MNEALVKDNIEAINAAIDRYPETVRQTVARREKQAQELIEAFQRDVEFRIDALAVSLIPYVNALVSRATIQTTRITLHASPEILAILAAIWTAVVAVYNVVKWIVNVIQTLKIFQIHQIVYSVWPQYRAFIDNLYKKVSEFSAQLGWGVDGVLHLIGAAKGGLNILAGFTKKGPAWLEMQWADKAVDVGRALQTYLTELQNDPSSALEKIFAIRQTATTGLAWDWWDEQSKWIKGGIDMATQAVTGTQTVITELSAIQEGMPEFVRRNIPQSIWDGLNRSERTINTFILPALFQANRIVTQIDAVINTHGNRLSELADRLAHPGELLLTVDDLPAYAKDSQLGMIDDVSSREFDKWTDAERGELASDMRNFDRIESALQAPTPQPEFMRMEVPAGKTIRGITAEPHETWFVGGYNDPR